MRQETTNTFDQGLNKDLNPIVTPNNVLTDALNATFITFNGDELTLQNDSGNTVIPIPGKDTPVKLSEGFYPIGIREYGGVLYIVSGKKEEGEEDMIEFGSYPSPEFAWPKEDINNQIIIQGYDLNSLYSSSVISNLIFKTGGYVRFSPVDIPNTENNDGEYLWTIYNTKGLYKVKLLHQLESGMYDLTDFVWEEYKRYKEKEDAKDLTLPESQKTNAPNHWIHSKEFKFYSPTKYKGKLAIRIELNEPELFELTEVPKAEFDVSSFKLPINMEFRDGESLKIKGYYLKLILDNKDPQDLIRYNRSDVPEPYVIPPETKTLEYEITPILRYYEDPVEDEFSWDAFPEEFKSKFLISGKLFLGAEHLGLEFLLREGFCQEGKKLYKVLIPVRDGLRFNHSLDLITEENSSDIPIAFYNNIDLDFEDKYKPIGYYSVEGPKGNVVIDTSFPEYVSWKEGLDTDSKRTIIEVFENMQINALLEDASCDTKYFYISINYEPEIMSINWESPKEKASYVKTGIQDGRHIYKVLLEKNRGLSIQSDSLISLFNASDMEILINKSDPTIVIDREIPKVVASNMKLISSEHPDTPVTGVPNSTGGGEFRLEARKISATVLTLEFDIDSSPSGLHIPEIQTSDVYLDLLEFSNSKLVLKRTGNKYTINTLLTAKPTASSGGGSELDNVRELNGHIKIKTSVSDAYDTLNYTLNFGIFTEYSQE